MMPPALDNRDVQEVPPSRRTARLAAYAVHLFTASGVVLAALMLVTIVAGDYRSAFLLMVLAGIIDAVDGTLARRFRVRHVCPEIDGRKLDDIVDYLNYTFLPIILLCQARWLPAPAWAWASIPLVASLLGFAHTGAKEENAGFFRGFPSYWNVVALYVAVWLHRYGQFAVLGVVFGLSVLTVLPVRFVYPNRPPRWTAFFVGGGIAWLAFLLLMLVQYPSVAPLLVAASLIYPVLYVALSIYLDIQARRDGR